MRGAARALGLAQPVMTRSLRELEQDLGTRLLERHARGVELTAAGRLFLVRAHAAMEEVRRGREELRQTGGAMEGAVTAGLSGMAMLALAPAAYEQFRRACPLVRLRLIEGPFPPLAPRLHDGSMDFYLGPRPERIDRKQFRVETWFANLRRVVVRRGHRLAGATRLDELLGADWLLTGLRERAEAELEELFEAHGLPVPPLRTRIDSISGVLSLLANTDAVALLPRQCVEAPMFRAVVQAVTLRETLGAPDIVLIHRAALPLTPAAEALASCLRRAGGQSALTPERQDPAER